MDPLLLLNGLFLGFAIAAPVGPIGVLCIRRTLAEGRIVGFVSGLGAATADAFYGAVAAFGLTFISSFLLSWEDLLRLVGGLFLVYLGVRTFLSRPATAAAAAKSGNLFTAYASTVALTITNPATIISFGAMFLGVTRPGMDYLGATLLVLGVFLGSAAWWLLLSGGVSILRSRFTPAMMLWVNRLSGAFLTIFGLAVLATLIG